MAKKSFSDNPALQFLSALDAEPEEIIQPPTRPAAEPPKLKNTGELDQSRLDEIRALIPEGYKLTPIKETRSKRIQLVLTPSLFNELKEAVSKAGISLNEYATQALIEKMKKENEE